MEPAQNELAAAIESTHFKTPICLVYQNASTLGHTDPEEIKANLVKQLTASVKWTQSIQNMIQDGAASFMELGPGKALQGMLIKINKDVERGGIS